MRPLTDSRLPTLAASVFAAAMLAACDRGGAAAPATAATRAAMTVTAVTPRDVNWPMAVTASGSIAAWQEASVGAEVAGLRITEVRVNVGDIVKKGDVLARLQSDTVKNDLAQQVAAVAEAEAAEDQARVLVERATELLPSGSMSKREFLAYQTQAATAAARVQSARALLATQQLRLRQTDVIAPDDGTISHRTATVGAMANPGGELFKLIRQNRLEWRAELRAQELGVVRPGMKAAVDLPGSNPVEGEVRQVAPTLDPVTRVGIAYVDLPDPPGRLKAGMFLSGRVQRGTAHAIVVPQESVVVLDGTYHVYRLGADNRVAKVGVVPGRRIGGEVEIIEGLDAKSQVVAVGAGFLQDGDVVKVVDGIPGDPKGTAKGAATNDKLGAPAK